MAARAAGRADRTRLQRAREEQADFFFKECLEIADRGKDSENESQARIQRDRLRIDTRKWMAARLAPKKYGGHISHDVQGGRTLNFQPAVLIKVEDEPATELDVSPAANRATRKVAPKDDVRGCNVVLGPTTASYLAPKVLREEIASCDNYHSDFHSTHLCPPSTGAIFATDCDDYGFLVRICASSPC